MVTPDQKEMLDVLDKQRQHQRKVDGILKIVLPIVGFLLAMICANMNIASTVGTLVLMILAFWMVGIGRQTLWKWATALAIYCVIDNLYSYGSFNINAFARQFGTMTTFLWIIGISRPYIDRWLMKSEQNRPQ